MGKLLIPKWGEVKTVEGPSAKLKLQAPMLKLTQNNFCAHTFSMANTFSIPPLFVRVKLDLSPVLIHIPLHQVILSVIICK